MVQDKIIKKDCITMDLPTNPEYVSVARLTVSAISNTIGFNVEEIEDISKEVDTSDRDLDKIAGRMNILKRIKEKYKICEKCVHFCPLLRFRR